MAASVSRAIEMTASVTRFGKISPLWQNFKSLRLFLEDLFFIGQNFDPNWANFMIWTNFDCF